MLLEIALFLISIALLYFYLYSYYNFWDGTCVPVLKPKYPLFGNLFDTLFSLNDLMSIQKEIYSKFPNERCVGLFQYTKPNLFLRDPALVERITTTDFAFLSDRGNADDPRATPISMHLVNAKDDHWRILRNKLTPTFTTGKLKGMHGQLLGCADALVDHLKTLENAKTFEAREVIARFTTDVIASCAFGLNLDTLKDPKSPFRAIGKGAFNSDPKKKLLRALRRLMGSKARFFNIPGGPSPKLVKFFIDVVDKTLDYRKKNRLVRQDFLHLMNELFEKDQELVRSGQMDPSDPSHDGVEGICAIETIINSKQTLLAPFYITPDIFDHATLVSNAYVFFAAGFETTATTISYAMYELALNQNIQDTLYKEIVHVLAKHDGKLTFESFQEMKYLDQIISETLRLHPPVPELIRKVTKEYHVPNTDVIMPVGSFMTLPIAAFHHDPQLFPDPLTFDPERFSEEKGQAIVKGSYIPFGNGPRICIGARFAKLEIQVALVKMVLKYNILRCNETQVPLTHDKVSSMGIPDRGIWLKIQPRTTAAA